MLRFERFEFGRRDGLVGSAALRHVGLRDFTAQQMHPTAFTLARRARQLYGGRRIAFGHLFQKRFDRRNVGKGVEPCRVQAQFGVDLKPLALISGSAQVGYRTLSELNDATPDFKGVT